MIRISIIVAVKPVRPERLSPICLQPRFRILLTHTFQVKASTTQPTPSEQSRLTYTRRSHGNINLFDSFWGTTNPQSSNWRLSGELQLRLFAYLLLIGRLASLILFHLLLLSS